MNKTYIGDIFVGRQEKGNREGTRSQQSWKARWLVSWTAGRLNGWAAGRLAARDESAKVAAMKQRTVKAMATSSGGNKLYFLSQHTVKQIHKRGVSVVFLCRRRLSNCRPAVCSPFLVEPRGRLGVKQDRWLVDKMLMTRTIARSIARLTTRLKGKSRFPRSWTFQDKLRAMINR